ncbi:MAG: hypothetical protein ACREUT_07325 [Steroidobacteraceae bacterium]
MTNPGNLIVANRRSVLVAALGIGLTRARYIMAADSAITTYGKKSEQAPSQLDLFSFLVGKWKGIGKTKLPDGSTAQFAVSWIGRYILNGMAIADEFHSLTPDGRRYLGISLRSFDLRHDCWIIEYLNVSNSFIRRQVNPQSGSVRRNGDTVAVISEDGQMKIRENYRVPDQSYFTYSTDASHDGGRTWDAVSIEISLERVE